MTSIPKRLLGNILGKKIRILYSNDPSLVGREGIITYETRNMLEIEESSGKRILIPKHVCIFEIYFDEKTKILVRGELLVNRLRKLIKLGRRR
ncbi:MAG: ribonuclease P component 1 family protein [Candidatus Njordarchaeales archaeon]